MRWMLAIALVAALAGPLRAEEAGKRIEMTGGVEFRAPPGFLIYGARTRYRMTRPDVRAPLEVTVMTGRLQSVILE